MSARLVVAAAAFATMVAASAAQAQDARVAVGDLDLGRPDQVQILQKRIDTAAHDWCYGQITTGSSLPQSGCIAMVRNSLVESLPPVARGAYQSARATTAAPGRGF